MQIALRSYRSGLSCAVLLSLTLLSACGEADSSRPEVLAEAPQPRSTSRISVRRSAAVQPLSGGYGAYLAGRAALSASDMSEGATRMLQALETDPTNPVLREQAFLAALMDGRPEALTLARQLPRQGGAQLLLLTDEARNSRWDRVELRTRGMANEGGMQLLRPLLQAWAQFGRGQVDAALTTLRPLSEGNGGAFYALHAGMIADLAERPNEAQRYYQRAEAADPQPNLRMALILSSFYARNGQPQNAQRVVAKLAAASDDFALILPLVNASQNTRPVPSAAAGIAEAYMTMGALLRQQQSNEEAMLMLRLALYLRPDFTPVRLLMADTFAADDQPAQADALLADVPGNDLLSPVVRMRRAQLLEAMDKKAEAEQALRAIARDYPERSEPLVRLGDLLRGQKRFVEATEAYNRAIALIPQREPRHWPLFYVRGIVLERSGEWEKAEADLQTALQLSPDQPYVLNYLGYTWADRGVNLEQAHRMLQRAVEQRPNDGHIVDSLGWVQFRMGNIPGALQTLERAAELEANDVTVNDHLGDLYWAAGRRREAEFQWRRALTLDPDPADIVKIEAKLRDGLPASQMPRAPR